MCFINFAPLCKPCEWIYIAYVTPALSPGVDLDAITLTDDYNYPQLQSHHVDKEDKFKRSEKLVEDAVNTSKCLMFFNSVVAVAVMFVAMFYFGSSALDSDVDGAFMAFYLMVFCFFLLLFETRRLIGQGKQRTQQEVELEERELASGLIDEANLQKYRYHTRHRYHFGFMYDSNLKVFFMFLISLSCFALGEVGVVCGIVFAAAALINAFVRCTRPNLYENLNEPRLRFPPPMEIVADHTNPRAERKGMPFSGSTNRPMTPMSDRPVSTESFV
jgi:hypothetical protein